MFRPSTVRLVAMAPTRAALRQTPAQAFRPVAKQQQQSLQRLTVRRFADAAAPPPPPQQQGGGGGSGMHLYIVLGAIVAMGGVGYWYLKPVRDVAAASNQAIQTMKSGANNAGDLASSLSSIAQAALPPGTFAIYSALANRPGGINGLISNLKDKDLQGVLDELKSAGGDDVKRVVEKVEKKLKAANNKVGDVDWKGLAEELKGELPASAQKAVDLLVGQIPGKEDVEQMVQKFKDIGEDKKKQLEAAASKVLTEVKKAQKEGKGQADAFIKGLKSAAPEDLDGLVKQLKDAAKSVGLPADAAESWLKSKAEEGKVNAEETAQQLQARLKTVAKWMPGEPKELVEQVKGFSPSIAELLAQAMKEAGIVDDKLNRKK